MGFLAFLFITAAPSALAQIDASTALLLRPPGEVPADRATPVEDTVTIEDLDPEIYHVTAEARHGRRPSTAKAPSTPSSQIP